MYDTQNDKTDEINISLEDTEETLVKMLETNIRTVVTVPIKLNSDEEDSDLVKIRKNILSQYAQVCYDKRLGFLIFRFYRALFKNCEQFVQHYLYYLLY